MIKFSTFWNFEKMARLQVTGPGVTNNNDDVALLLAQAVDKNIT